MPSYVKVTERHASMLSAHLAPGWPSLYLLVRHEPSASITGADVKFSLAISSMPFLQRSTTTRLLMLPEQQRSSQGRVCG